MSSIGTGYDLAASTFSPDGRIFQVEYAQKAVDNSFTVVSLGSKYGVVTAVEKAVTSKLYVENDSMRIINVTAGIGLAGCGFYPDCRALSNYAQDESTKYLKEYRDIIPIKKLADTIAEYIHIFTLGISRPFGSSLFISSWNEKGPFLYCVEPSGLSYQYKAWAIGRNRQAARTEIEKLAGEGLEELSLKQLLNEAIRILLTVRDEKQKKHYH